MDRFWLCEIGYPEADAEAKLLERLAPSLPEDLRRTMVDYANQVRRLFIGEGDNQQPGETIELTFSTRTLIRWADLTQRFQPLARQGVQPVIHALDRALGFRASRGTRALLHELGQRMFAPPAADHLFLLTPSFPDGYGRLPSSFCQENPMSTDITVLKQLTAIRLDVNIWSARKKLTPADFGTSNLPPESIASLGSKKVCNPEDLRVFGALKARAVALLDRHGVRFLGGCDPETATSVVSSTRGHRQRLQPGQG
jgi:hypothetical protein